MESSAVVFERLSHPLLHFNQVQVDDAEVAIQVLSELLACPTAPRCSGNCLDDRINWR